MDAESVGTDFPKQQARVRALISNYRDLPNNAGTFAAMMLEDTLRRADEAQSSGDILAILASYEEMRECK